MKYAEKYNDKISKRTGSIQHSFDNFKQIESKTYRDQHALWFFQCTAASQESDDNDKCGNANKYQQPDIQIIFPLGKWHQEWCIGKHPSKESECSNTSRL